jgi:hypothetical protein
MTIYMPRIIWQSRSQNNKNKAPEILQRKLNDTGRQKLFSNISKKKYLVSNCATRRMRSWWLHKIWWKCGNLTENIDFEIEED